MINQYNLKSKKTDKLLPKMGRMFKGKKVEDTQITNFNTNTDITDHKMHSFPEAAETNCCKFRSFKQQKLIISQF